MKKRAMDHIKKSSAMDYAMSKLVLPTPISLVVDDSDEVYDWLLEQGIITETVPIVPYRGLDWRRLEGIEFFGLLPPYIACRAKAQWALDISKPHHLRGASLSKREGLAFITGLSRYEISRKQYYYAPGQ